MGIAFSDSRIVYRTFSATTAAGLIEAIHHALTDARWVGTAVGAGYRYVLESRQSLRCQCKISDEGYRNLGERGITVRFMSYDQSQKGYEHPILYSLGRTYEIIAGRSQMFLAAVGAGSISPEGPGGQAAHFVCGGVPYVSLGGATCAGLPTTEGGPTDVWWSSGSGNSFFGPRGFRIEWRNGSSWDGGWQGTRLGGFSVPEERVLRLSAVAHPLFDYGFMPSGQKTQWMDGKPLYLDPLLIWGEPLGRVRGQIWDAMLGSKDMPLGHTLQTSEVDPETGADAGVFTWRNWMHSEIDMTKGAPGTYYSSLYLLTQTDPVPVRSNYAY
jgi:hypothetical protein